MRKVKVAIVKVYFNGLSLWQSKRKDTKVVEGISERLEENESFRQAAIRGLKEELGISPSDIYDFDENYWMSDFDYEEVKMSESTGEMTRYRFKVFLCDLHTSEVKCDEDGFIISDNIPLPQFPVADGGVEFEWR